MVSQATTARRYLVAGRVQGVGFRYFVLRSARELELAGWVRNLADRRVEVHAQGDPAVLDDLESRLRMGPAGADVRSLEVREAAPELCATFQILG